MTLDNMDGVSQGFQAASDCPALFTTGGNGGSYDRSQFRKSLH